MGRHDPEVYLNLNVRGLELSPTLAINERCAELQREGRTVYRFGLGQSPFPVPRPVVETLKVNAREKDYLPVKGLPKLRHAVAEYHRRTNGVECNREDIMIAPGSKELMFLLQLVYYGDLVIPTPAWVSYAPQAHMIGRHVQLISTNPKNLWRLTAQELNDLCERDQGRPRIVVLNYPSNPTGVSYRVDDLKAIAQVARKHRVILLSDEIYGELHHRGKHVSVARYYPEGTIVSSGLSKWCGAGGWRLGTFAFPKSLAWLLDAMAVAASETFTSTSAPIQFAAVRAFQGGTSIETYLKQSRRVLLSVSNHVVKELQRQKLKVTKPDGGFYLFPDFSAYSDNLAQRGITTSNQLCERLLEETGVAILPGTAFGRPASELSARLAFVDFDGARALSAIENENPTTFFSRSNDEFLHSYCPNVVKGIELLGDWLRAQ